MTIFRTTAKITVADLVAAAGTPARIIGDADRPIVALGSLADASPGGLYFCNAARDEIFDRLIGISDATVVVSDKATEALTEVGTLTLVAVSDPRRYFIRAFNDLIGEQYRAAPGISPHAHVHADAEVSQSASIGAFSFVDQCVTIGAGAVLMGGVHVHAGTTIDAGALIQANSVLGCQGQSYERDPSGDFISMPHRAGLRLGRRVVVGAGTTIVRGTLQDTEIGSNTVIGNQVNIGHNVVIGERCHIGAGAIICGSSRLGDEVWISIASVVRSVPVGSGAMVGAGGIVTREVASGVMVNGFPARATAKFNDYNQRSGR